MPDTMPADAGSPTPTGESVETEQRFRRICVLIHDDQRRRRRLFMLSLLGLATVDGRQVQVRASEILVATSSSRSGW
jgi:hypothetical protein